MTGKPLQILTAVCSITKDTMLTCTSSDAETEGSPKHEKLCSKDRLQWEQPCYLKQTRPTLWHYKLWEKIPGGIYDKPLGDIHNTEP